MLASSSLSSQPPAAASALEWVLTEAQNASKVRDFAKVDELLNGFSGRIAAACEIFIHGRRPSAPVASLIVVSHRENDQLPSAIDAIAQQCPSEQWEVIFVDNGNSTLFDLGLRKLPAFVGIKPPFSLGCSAGRNAGAAHAVGHILVFLDDDGVMEKGCADALLSCLIETNAVSVRGRVLPITSRSAPHYDLGMERIPSFVDCEGVSAWRRDVFLQAGGFHPLLAGHEGIELCAKLWRHHGPLAFVYEPSAVLRHDFTSGGAAVVEKAGRYARNRALAEAGGASPFEIHAKIQELATSGKRLHASVQALRAQPSSGGVPVSIITTAYNARQFADEYSAGWKRQTQQQFQLVYVDDGSQDGTSEAIRRQWSGDDRLTLIEQSHCGRGAALNTALAAARHDICLIADADDIAVPSRIAWTVDFFSANGGSDCVSFVVFTEANLFRVGPPSLLLEDMAFRSLFDMPAAFPAFAFRRHRFPEAFDVELKGGVDCDWLRRNMEAANVQGKLVPYPAVYYRRHKNQITASHNSFQRAARAKLLEFSYGRLAGPLSDEEKRLIAILTGSRPASVSERRKLGGLVMRLLRENGRRNIHPADLLRQMLLDRLDWIGSASKETDDPQLLREKADHHIWAGEFKKARRILRKALETRNDPELRIRFLAASRYGIVRALAQLPMFGFRRATRKEE
jgi:glycosyltransferase involved in cell wall biosynthesis